MKSLLNILWLGLKEIRSLLSDMVMVAFVIYAFTLAIYVQATGTSSEVNNASIALCGHRAMIRSSSLPRDTAGTGVITFARGECARRKQIAQRPPFASAVRCRI